MWSHDFWIDGLRDAGIIFGAILAGLALFRIPYRKVLDWYRGKESRHGEAQRLIFEVVPDMQEQLVFIASELRPNHGTSLRDAVNRIENGMLENRATIRAFVSLQTEAIFITDRGSNLVYANQSFTELTNRDTAELFGQKYWGIVEPAELPAVRLQQQSARADKRDMLIYFNVATGDPDFPLVPVKLIAVPILDKDNEVDGYLGTLTRLDNHEKEAE